LLCNIHFGRFRIRTKVMVYLTPQWVQPKFRWEVLTMPKTPKNILNSNAGLLELQNQLKNRKSLKLSTGLMVESELLAAVDGIAIAYPYDVPDNIIEAATQRIVAILGRGWFLRDESLEAGDLRFRGVTALPPVGQSLSLGDAWSLARQLAIVDGIRSATPLFAQIAPNPAIEEGSALTITTDEEEKQATAGGGGHWHLKELNIQKAWEAFEQKGWAPGEGVTAAVVDTGYTDHPEIFDRLTKVNGQPEKVRGVDILDGDDPRDPLDGGPPLTFPSHGTSVISVIASQSASVTSGTGNLKSVHGIAPGALVLPVRVTTNVALLLPNKITPGIRAAIDEGADVINISLGLPYYWSALHAAVRYATEQGVIVVAASGNYWPTVVYPARFPEVLAAANCNSMLREWRWASAGDAVDILAPGVAIPAAYSAKKGDQVTYRVMPGTGTTFAAACCTGLAALWLSFHGGREALINHYEGEAWRVSQAFHYLIRGTATALPQVSLTLYGEGLPKADLLLQAPLPTKEELDHDVWGLHLHLTPLAEPMAASLPGLALGALDEPILAETIQKLLGEGMEGSRPEELLNEINFHLLSRWGLRTALMQGHVDEVRQVLLGSRHLSVALRNQLASAGEVTVKGLLAKEERVPAAEFQAREISNPAHRSLQVYAFDPSLSSYLRTVDYNVATVSIPWESLDFGPVGDYLEVVDVDPASESAYEPVNLDDPRLLASDGVNPDEGDPWFHQQMVYAVAMKTIQHFEAALGRPAMWAVGRQKEGKEREPFYQRLRIYPHALRERNAYYSPEKRALLFGYFRSPGPGGEPAGPMVFTCLSYDIIAHETTHALLDGMYPYFIYDTNVDMLAFHEAFADIVALFQHFSHPEVLRAAIAETRGDLGTDSHLGKLAQQFGEATGHRGALRDAIGEIKDGKWQRRQPNPDLLDADEYKSSPHLRGSILVAAVFDAFLKIYQRRTQLLVRLATGGSGILPPGNISADLAEALSLEAAKTARHVLNLCIRALDYLPPIDITFGEYLRAAITADRALVPDDDLGYRVALVEAFRGWGIQPEGVTTITPENLSWSRPEGIAAQFALSEELLDHLNRLLPAWRLNRSRAELHHETVQAKIRFNQELKDPKNHGLSEHIGIDLSKPFEVHTLRPATTVGPDGTINPIVVVTLLQKKTQDGKPTIRTGSTLLFSRGDGKIQYVVHKRDRRGRRADETEEYQKFRRAVMADIDPYFISIHPDEPFAALHLTGHT
jgi:hypothetical protein